MKRVHIIGGKNHGKTTLVVDLIRALSNEGLRVGSIKHTHHQHEFDTPGKDSHRHREAGAAVVGICSPSMNAIFWAPREHDTRATNQNDLKYAGYEPVFAQCDLVLVEGDSKTNAPKIEVWRSEIGLIPLAETDTSIAAIISDDAPPNPLAVPLWRRSDAEAIVANLLKLVGPRSLG